MKNKKSFYIILVAVLILIAIGIAIKHYTDDRIDNWEEVRTVEPDIADRGNYPSLENPVVGSPDAVVKESLNITTDSAEKALDVYSDFYYDPAMIKYKKYLGMKLPVSLSVVNSSGEVINIGNSNKPVVLAFTNKDDTFFFKEENKFADFDKFSKEYDNYTFATINMTDADSEEFYNKLPFGYMLNNPTKEVVDFMTNIDIPCVLYIKENKVILSSYPAIATSISNVAFSIFKEALDGETVFSEFDLAVEKINSTRLTGVSNPRVPSTISDAEKLLEFKPIIPRAFKNGSVSVISEKVLNIDINNQTFRASRYIDISGDYTEYLNYNSALNDEKFTISMYGNSKTEYNLIKWTNGEIYFSIFSETPLTEEEVLKIVK